VAGRVARQDVSRPLGGDLVEPCGQSLGEATGVGEHDGRAVLLDEVDEPLLHVRPDRLRRTAVVVSTARAPQLGHVLDRHHHRQVPPLGARRRHHAYGGRAGEEARHLLHRAHGCRQPDPLGRPLQHRIEPLERHRQVGAPLAAGDGVHLVDDDGVDAREHLARPGGEHQEQRLGGGDEDVRRRGADLPAVRGRGVARPQRDGDVMDLGAQPPAGLGDADERGTQVALDVHGQCLQRRHVQDAAPALLVRWRRCAGQPVECPQEGRQRLARTGGRHHQRVLPGADRIPGAALGCGRLGEGAGEPLPGGGGEPLHDVGGRHLPIFPDATDNGLRGARPAPTTRRRCRCATAHRRCRR
jgi:hypothetical protein